MLRVASLLLAAALAAFALPCAAHERSVSYSTWNFDENGADVEVRLDGRQEDGVSAHPSHRRKPGSRTHKKTGFRLSPEE